MHEIGHTLGLHHSGENSNSYDDLSGQMGVSYKGKVGGRRCFNPAKSWQLGWYSKESRRLDPLLDDMPFSIVLKGFADEIDSNDDQQHSLLKMNSFPAPTTFHSHFWSVLCLYSIFCSVWRIQPLSFSSSFLLARSIDNFGYLFRNFIFTYCMLHEFYMRREWRCWLSLWRTRWLFLFTSSRPLGLPRQATNTNQMGDLASDSLLWESPFALPKNEYHRERESV